MTVDYCLTSERWKLHGTYTSTQYMGEFKRVGTIKVKNRNYKYTICTKDFYSKDELLKGQKRFASRIVIVRQDVL